MFRRAVFAILATTWAFAGSLLPARAVEDIPGTPHVVIVGIDNFADPQIKPRKHAEADAKALYDVFTDKAHLGVEAGNIKLLLGTPDQGRKSEPATRENILKALEWLEKTTTKDDLVIFAILTQGSPLGERAVYFASDSTFKDRAKNAVANGDIETYLNKLKSERFLALVDVNFMGIDLGKEKTPDADTRNFFKEYFGGDDAEHAPNRVIFLPNSGLKPSLESDKHGLFTEVLVDGLKGKADSAGYEPDGNILVGELIKYFKKEFSERASAIGKDDEEKSQLGVALDLHTTDFVIDHNPAAHDTSVERLKKFDAIIKDQKLAKDLAEEGVNL